MVGVVLGEVEIILKMEQKHLTNQLGVCNNICIGTQMEKVTITTQDLISIPQAAKQLGVHFTTVYRWIKQGKVVPFTIGTQDFLTATAVKQLEKERGTHK